MEQVKAGVVRIETSWGNGTGFIFETTEQGGALILTNYHVIEDAWAITVRVNDSDTYEPTVRGYNAYRDLALLEICCGDFRALDMAAPAEIKAGTEVMAIGYPLDIAGSSTVTKGIASAYRYDHNYESWVVQTDAPINSGSSGGPLIKSNGEVIGINTYVMRGNYGLSAEGLGFAISQQSIKEVLADLKLGSRLSLPTPTPTPTLTPTPTPKPTPVAWRTYINRTYRYTLEVPRDWIVDESDKSHVLFNSPDQMVWVSVSSYSWQADLESWADLFIDQYRNTHSRNFKVFDRKIEQRPNGSGAAFVFLGGDPPGFSCIESVAIVMRVLRSRSYALSSGVCLSSHEQYSEIWNSLLTERFSPY